MDNRIKIIAVDNRRTLNRFIKLPWRLYQDDPNWVAPLILERKLHFAPKNPYFQHARWQAWLALIDGGVVGRISAQIDQLHLDTHQDNSGFFGLLEAIDDPEVFQQLTETAEQWLRDQGMTTIRGPYNLSINQESGLLVEGFDTPPRVMMGHALPYYAERLEAAAYHKVRDLLAFEIDSRFSAPRAMQAVVKKTSSMIELRNLNRKQADQDFALLCEIFNDAWSENWGFVPFTEAEFQDIGNTFKFLLDDDFVKIATVDGTPAGMIVILPDINELIKDLNGKLFPIGLLKLLWRLKFAPAKQARVPLMGVAKRYRHSMVGTALAYRLIDAVKAPCKRVGINQVELSWVLENNHNLIEIIESLGGRQSKCYRIYEKSLIGTG